MKIDTKTKDAVKSKLAEREQIHPDIQSVIDAHKSLANSQETEMMLNDAKRLSRMMWGLRQREIQKAEMNKRVEAAKSINVKSKKGK